MRLSASSALDNDLRRAILAIAGVGGIEVEGDQIRCFEANGLMAKIVEGADEEARTAEQQNAERDLRAHGQFAEALRAFGSGAGILPQSLGQIGTQKMEAPARC